MVSPNECFIGQPVKGSPERDQMSPNTRTDDDSEATTSAVALTGQQLQRLLHQNCTLEHNQQVMIGADHSSRLCLGTVCQSVQRRSVTHDLQLVANGLKPVKGSANKFSVNKVYESDRPFGSSQNESVIEFTKCLQSAEDYPISSDANVVATGRHSRLYVIDDRQITCIRPADGFVVVESDLVVFDLDGQQTYPKQAKGHLFILGRSAHLLILDRSDRKQSILIVGTGGLTTHSLTQSPTSSTRTSDTYEDRPIRLVSASFTRPTLNGQQSTRSKCSEAKRCSDDQQLHNESKRQKCRYSDLNGRFVGVEPS